MNKFDKLKITNSSGVYREFTFDTDVVWTNQNSANLSTNSVSLSTSQAVGQVGETINSATINSRTVILNFKIIKNVVFNRNDMINFFLPSTKMVVEVVKDGTSYFIDGVLTEIDNIGLAHGIFTMTIYASFPYWRTKDQIKEFNTVSKGFRFPNTFKNNNIVQLGYSNTNPFASLTNNGNAMQFFKATMTFRGTVSNPSIIFYRTNQKVKFDYTFVAGQQVEISTEPGNRYVRETTSDTNFYKYLSSDSVLSILLYPGENVLKVEADSNEGNVETVLYASEGSYYGI